MHCGTCGHGIRPIVGAWAHTDTPGGFDPAYCTWNMSTPYPVQSITSLATLCTDTDCPCEQEDTQ